tara:strand:- start:22337 stop:22678 length:342 start_codon:yes stop_codon:yes gene_type:complete
MKTSAQAMVPEFFGPAVEEATKKIKAPEKGDENLILDFAESRAWEYLKGIIQGIQISITEESKKISGQAKTWEEVAKVYYGRDVSIDSFQTVIDMIELHKIAKYAPKPPTIEE